MQGFLIFVCSEDGLWDPDLWISSFTASAGEVAGQTKRKTVTDGDAVARKRPMSESSIVS
jgi:hypothetical protein